MFCRSSFRSQVDAVIARKMNSQHVILGPAVGNPVEVRAPIDCFIRAVRLKAVSFNYDTGTKACTPIEKVGGIGPILQSNKNVQSYFFYKERTADLCERSVNQDVSKALYGK
ncbi:hypothetical protein QR680_011785 [Steinernema hermaphroditum]|uniref:Uncharacterized protein n=1 Tax=Steinernema hermaphroditum TaxID=289476 RepID=A0AA39LZB9_9BILA|nr:hypothetical protein QR680_011785 [Steinernema hermaphroditum]